MPPRPEYRGNLFCRKRKGYNSMKKILAGCRQSAPGRQYRYSDGCGHRRSEDCRCRQRRKFFSLIWISHLAAGCGNCRDITLRKMLREDDMQELYGKIFAADALILGTPVYWWGPSAQLKMFIDRWYAFLGDKTASLAERKSFSSAPWVIMIRVPPGTSAVCSGI